MANVKNHVSIHLALPYTASNKKFSLVYFIYLNLSEDHFWLRDLGLSTAYRVPGKYNERQEPFPLAYRVGLRARQPMK